MNSNGINVISCFDGLAGGMTALKRAGIKVNKYYAFEIDKYAIKIATKNHPEIVELGDINNWVFFDEIEVPDLIIAGSPCQGFSIAGKGLNFEDPRSKLFFIFIDVLKYWKFRNPNLKFMLENVKMKQEWSDIITTELGVSPVLINSALVSAQNRKRLFWTNIEGITQPEDRGLVLKDILEDGNVDRDKSYCVDANYWKGGNEKSYFGKGRRQLVFKGAALRNQVTKRGVESQLNIRKDDKSNCVVPTYPQKLNGIVRIGTATDINGHDILKRVYSPEGKSPTIDSFGGGNREPKIDTDGVHYRKLTPLECERLQTLPDNYTEGVSNTQRYRMIGNGWTIEVIKHIFSFLPKEFFK